MINIISKNEDVGNSVVYLGYLILNAFIKRNTARLSIYDVSKELYQFDAYFSDKQIMYSLVFLNAIGVAEFEEPYIVVNKKASKRQLKELIKERKSTPPAKVEAAKL
ncbi:MAG: hypothetical protein ACO1RX_14860 [Candidatus Sericytochromatia bacterium]